MLKKICLIIFAIGVLAVCSSCNLINSTALNNEDGNTNEIIIKSGEKNITVTVNPSNENNSDDSDTRVFQSIIKDTNLTIPYVKLGETIQIDFKNEVTSTYQLKDYILREDGTPKYEKPTIVTTDIEFNKGVGTFVLSENIWVYLSSNFADYEPGKTIRGFLLVCNNKDNEKEYAFIIRTDPTKDK